MKLPSFRESFEFSNSPIIKKAWHKFFFKHFYGDLVEIEDYEDNMCIQSQSWDWALIFRDQFPILRAELKTRQPKIYDFFRNDGKILIETKGNVQLNTGGSAIYYSNAELWCYGFLQNNEIYEGFIFQREKLATWLQNNELRYDKRYSNTDNLYNTEFVLIPFDDIEQFIFKTPL